MATLLPDTTLFVYFYVRKEAVLSSAIEGTQSTLTDLLEHEGGLGAPTDDVGLVSNYVAAMNHGLRRMRDDNFPLSLRLIREMHQILLKGGRGGDKQPGKFRSAQNWIGGRKPSEAAHVPPPPNHLDEVLGKLERFLHDSDFPPLVTAALVHAQFETIHPFLDGNGRIGRLLITLYLCKAGVLREPSLYLSLYFKQHRQEYYDRLSAIREGDWEGWISFFLTGVEATAAAATELGRTMQEMFKEHCALLKGRGDFGTREALAIQVLDAMRQQPIATVRSVAKITGRSEPTIRRVMTDLEALDLLRETTQRTRGRVYAYAPYLKAMA